MAYVDISQKTLVREYPEYPDLFIELQDALLYDVKDDEIDVLTSFKYGYWVWLRWGHRIYKGSWASFFSKFKAHYASTFYEIRQDERIYKNIYSQLKLEAGKLIKLENTEYSKISKDDEGDEKKEGEETLDKDQQRMSSQSKEHKSGSIHTSKEKPFSSLDLLGQHFGNMVQDEYRGRADWLGGEDIEQSGYIALMRYPEGHPKHGEIVFDDEGNPVSETNPNYEKNYNTDTFWDFTRKGNEGRSDYRKSGVNVIDKTFTREEQPLINGQMARFLMSYDRFKSYPTDRIDSFRHLFSDVCISGGETIFNPDTWEYEYVSQRELIAMKPTLTQKVVDLEDLVEEQEKEKYRDLSKEEWELLWDNGEGTKPCMPDWYLEQIYRYWKRIETQAQDKRDADFARVEYCQMILDTFYRPTYNPPITVFEAFMGSPAIYYIKEKRRGIYVEVVKGTDGAIQVGPWTHYKVEMSNLETAIKNKKDNGIQIGDILECEVEGFFAFKQQMWRNLKVAKRNRRLGKQQSQVFPTLIGPPGTGKSQIAQDMASAFQVPLEILNLSRVDDAGYFSGKRPTLENASVGALLNGFLNRTRKAEVEIKDLEAELKEITHYKSKTTNTFVERKNLHDWEKKRAEELRKEIDDWEKDNQERVANGKKILTKKIKFYRSRGLIFLFDEFEKMASLAALQVIGNITDRELNWSFKDDYLGFRVDLSRCWIILTANYPKQVPEFLKERLLNIIIELLTWWQRRRILRKRFEKELKRSELAHHMVRVTDDFIDMCITETFGVRGGINNVIATVSFLETLEVIREEAEEGLAGAQNPFQPLDKTTTYVIGKPGIYTLDKPDRIIETRQEEYLKSGLGSISLIWDNVGGEPQTLTLTKKLGIEKRVVEDSFGERTVNDFVTGVDEHGKTFVPTWGGNTKKVNGKDYMWWNGYADTVDDEPNNDIGYIIRDLTTEKKGDTVKPYQLDVNVNGLLQFRVDAEDNDDDKVYTFENLNIRVQHPRFNGGTNTEISRIKLVAVLGLREQQEYLNMVNEGNPANYVLTIRNISKAILRIRNGVNTINIYSRWDLRRKAVKST